MLSKQDQLRNGRIKPKVSQKNKDRQKHSQGSKIDCGRIKEPYEHCNSGRGTLLIPKFMKWVSEQPKNKGLERHHYFTGSGKLDCFIVCISPTLHHAIHFGDIGVQGYINEVGRINLILSSMAVFEEWINKTECYEYKPLLDEIMANPENAVEIARNFQL